VNGHEQHDPSGIDWNRVGEILARQNDASQSPTAPPPVTPQFARSRSRRAWVPAAVLVPVLLAGGVITLTSGGSDEVDAAAPVTSIEATTDTTATPPGSTVAVDPATTAAPDTTAVPAPALPAPDAPPTTAPAGAEMISSPAPVFPERMAEPGNALYADGKLYMRGPISDRETAEQLVERATAVMGAGNVIYEYWVQPGTPAPQGTVEVADTVLFAPGSAEIGPESTATIDLAVTFLSLYPNVGIEVTGHTDSVGDEASNMALSEQRVASITAYLRAGGIDPLRVTGIAAGESDPKVVELTVEDRAANRRVEVRFVNVLS
jgi:outer membrane protein OmpA-like peptidoglycan-associated protein